MAGESYVDEKFLYWALQTRGYDLYLFHTTPNV